MSRLLTAVLVLVLVVVVVRKPASAGGPLLIGKDGAPRRWSTASPLVINLDRGALGKIANPSALMEHAVGQWNDVGTAALKVQIGEPLSSDVEGLSESQFDALITKDDGTNPVIFDSTGEIFASIYGARSGVVGVAGPSLVMSSNGTIVKGFAMFNGADATDDSAEVIKAALTHELGHMLNLEHAQINGSRMGTAIPGFDGVVNASQVETMFPVLVQSAAKPHPMATLHMDDMAAFSALYPAGSFASSTASITGLVLDIDGQTHIQGVNVIARSISRPFDDAVSYVSGLLFDPASPSAPPALHGAYELRGLTPNETYKVYIEEVASFFRGGARVGPLDPPLDLDPTQAAAFLEFWNGAGESADDPPDDPMDATSLKITAGGAAARVDFVFNGVHPRVASIDPASGSYLELTTVAITGANFVGDVSVLFRNADGDVSLQGVQVVDSSTLEARVPPGVTPGVYEVIAFNPRGESEPGGVEFAVTEPRPAVTGTSPDAVENDRPRQVNILGSHLLGARAALLRKAGSPDVPLESIEVVSSGRITAQVPAGVLPGSYAVIVRNTAGDSPPSAALFFILELAPLLSGETEPPSARNSGSKTVRILGANLAGATGVELVNGGTTVPLGIVSTSLGEVVVTVPGGLEPGTYMVRITNTEGSVTGPTVFIVRRSSGGGGGGCSALGGPDRIGLDLFSWIVLLALARGWNRLARR